MVTWFVAVFYLKYRPSSIGDLDLSDVSEKLTKILSSKEVPQAFLFAGPKGSGKTSAARVLARALNCLERKGVEPCNQCGNCKEILNGSSIDIIEIDAASNRGIDDIRALKDKAYFLPGKLKNKVFVIDEVHMLTKEAFNALLKIIEEPPSNTYFVLCTTDAQNLPETVVSRLVRVDFRRGNRDELKRSLNKIIKGEKLEMSDEAAKMFLERCEGSFRNLHRIVNEVFLQSGKKIGVEEATKYFERVGGDYNGKDLEDDLARGLVGEILVKLEKLAEKGVDFARLREGWLAYFQQRLLAKYGLVKEETAGEKLDEEALKKWIYLLIGVSKIEKETEISQLPLELAVVDFLAGKGGQDTALTIKEEVAERPKTVKSLPVKAKPKVGKTVAEENDLRAGDADQLIDLEEVLREWPVLLTKIRPFNHSVEAFLRATRPREVKGKTVVVEVFYPFHKERLEEVKNRQIVEDCMRDVFGKDLLFECLLGKGKGKPLVIENETAVAVVEQQVNNSTGSDDIYEVAKEIFG